MYFAYFANATCIQHLLRLHINAAIALLKAEGDVDLAVGTIGCFHDALATGDVETGGLFHEDMLA